MALKEDLDLFKTSVDAEPDSHLKLKLIDDAMSFLEGKRKELKVQLKQITVSDIKDLPAYILTTPDGVIYEGNDKGELIRKS